MTGMGRRTPLGWRKRRLRAHRRPMAAIAGFFEDEVVGWYMPLE